MFVCVLWFFLFNTLCYSATDLLTSMEILSNLKYPEKAAHNACDYDDNTQNIWCLGGTHDNNLATVSNNVYSFDGLSFTTQTQTAEDIWGSNSIMTILNNVAYIVDSRRDSYVTTYNLLDGSYNSVYASYPQTNLDDLQITSDNLDRIFVSCDSGRKRLYSLNTSTVSWTTYSSKSNSVHWLGGIKYYNYYLYLFMGDSVINNKIEYINVNNDNGFIVSNEQDSFPSDYGYFSTTVLPNGIIYLFGGYSGVTATYSNTIYVYDTNTDTAYVSSVTLNENKIAHECEYLYSTDAIYCFGGYNDAGNAPDEFYDTVERSNFDLTGPTVKPSNNPTVQPTNDPINVPTNNPNISPTNNPLLQPSNNPTNNPTFIPTNNPSIDPTNNPNISPTNNPILQPSNNPTSLSLNPTKFPSNKPIVEPTEDPTIASNSPTEYPAEEPTNTPSKYPSIIYYTNDPTVSQNPNVKPSNNPTLYPTTQSPSTTKKTIWGDITITTIDSEDYDAISDSQLVTIVFSSILQTSDVTLNSQLLFITITSTKTENGIITITYYLEYYGIITSNTYSEDIIDTGDLENTLASSNPNLFDITSLTIENNLRTINDIYTSSKISTKNPKPSNNSRNTTLYITIVACIIVIAFILIYFVYYRTSKKQKKKNEIEMNKLANHSKINKPKSIPSDLVLPDLQNQGRMPTIPLVNENTPSYIRKVPGENGNEIFLPKRPTIGGKDTNKANEGQTKNDSEGSNSEEETIEDENIITTLALDIKQLHSTSDN